MIICFFCVTLPYTSWGLPQSMNWDILLSSIKGRHRLLNTAQMLSSGKHTKKTIEHHHHHHFFWVNQRTKL